MAVITGGNVIRNTRQIEGSRPRMLPWSGVPVGATTYAGVVAVGDFVVDVNTGNLYEYTEPAAVPTYTRRDTV